MQHSVKTAMDQNFHRVEIAGLFILAFSLPLSEAVKHIGYFALITGAVGWRLMSTEKITRKPFIFETIIILILSTALVSTMINWPLYYGIKGFKHFFYFFSTFWVIANGNYTIDTIKKTMVFMITGALVASFIGFWEFYHTKELLELTLLSINGINKTAGYLSIVLFVCIGIVVDNDSGYPPLIKLFSAASSIVVLVYICIIGSRGCLLSIAITFILLLLIYIFMMKKKKWTKKLWVFSFFLLFSVFLLAPVLFYSNISNSTLLQRLKRIENTRFTLNPAKMIENDRIRYDIWRTGIMYAINHPSLFGVGPRDFRRLDFTTSNQRPPVTDAASEWFNKNKVLHAHNWILTLFIEQGFLGLLWFVTFLITITIKILRNRPENSINAVWIASVAACFLPCISGLFNSAFSDENGWLTFFVLGLGIWFVMMPASSENPLPRQKTIF